MKYRSFLSAILVLVCISFASAAAPDYDVGSSATAIFADQGAAALAPNYLPAIALVPVGNAATDDEQNYAVTTTGMTLEDHRGVQAELPLPPLLASANCAAVAAKTTMTGLKETANLTGQHNAGEMRPQGYQDQETGLNVIAKTQTRAETTGATDLATVLRERPGWQGYFCNFSGAGQQKVVMQLRI